VAKVNLLSQKEYAKHRGCTPAAVCKAVKDKRISIDSDGKIDPVVADIQWDANSRARTRNVSPDETGASPSTRAGEGEGSGVAQMPLDTEDAGAAGDETGNVAAGGDPKYMTSRASREEAAARRAWLALLEEEKQLVRIDQVRAYLAERLAPVREAFMQLPARLAPEFAAETDAAKIQNLLEGSIHEILARLRPE
jgi:hypothetical protein